MLNTTENNIKWSTAKTRIFQVFLVLDYSPLDFDLDLDLLGDRCCLPNLSSLLDDLESLLLLSLTFLSRLLLLDADLLALLFLRPLLDLDLDLDLDLELERDREVLLFSLETLIFLPSSLVPSRSSMARSISSLCLNSTSLWWRKPWINPSKN